MVVGIIKEESKDLIGLPLEILEEVVRKVTGEEPTHEAADEYFERVWRLKTSKLGLLYIDAGSGHGTPFAIEYVDEKTGVRKVEELPKEIERLIWEHFKEHKEILHSVLVFQKGIERTGFFDKIVVVMGDKEIRVYAVPEELYLTLPGTLYSDEVDHYLDEVKSNGKLILRIRPDYTIRVPE